MNNCCNGPGIRLSKIIHHPNYTRHPTRHDIALMKLEKPLSFTDKIQPATLPPRTSESVNDLSKIFTKPCLAAGWRSTEDTGNGGKRFTAVELKLKPLAFCRRLWKMPFKSEICSFVSGVPNCEDDTAGSLICEDILVSPFKIHYSTWGMRKC